MKRAYVGLGSNLRDSPGILREAFSRLQSLGRSFVNSDLYITEPWGKTDQPPFYNAAAAFDTQLEPRGLVRQFHAIENEFGRVRSETWGPRTLDLDLLLYGDAVVDEPDCRIPHPRMRERAFVLGPLTEIGAGVEVPGGPTVDALWDALSDKDRATIRRLRGTAILTPPPRVDYDEPGGAGAQYDVLRPFSPFDRAVFDSVLGAIAPARGKRILDVGCGTGRFTRRLADAGAFVTGLDASETMLASARSRPAADPVPIDYVRGDANSMLPPGPYDAVTAFYCMQYIDSGPWCRRVVRELVPGGVVAVATFPHRHFTENSFARFYPSLPALDMARFPSVPVLESSLASAGFERIETDERTIDIEDDPAVLIPRVEAKYLSSFFLLSDAEFRAGLSQMREEWGRERTVHRIGRSVVISGRAPRSIS